MKKWKSFIMAAAVAIFTGAVFTGCGSGDGGVIYTGNEVSADNGPAAPKEAVTKLKLGDKEVPMYAYKGADTPQLVDSHGSLAVTKDAIYGISFEKKEEKYHLKKMSLKDGAITGVEDLGEIKKEPLSSDGTNVYYILDTNGKIGCYDGTAATSFDVKGIRTICTIYGDKNAYVCGDFVSRSDTMFGAISKEGMKDPKVVLPKDEFGKLSQAKDATKESNASLVCADKDGFYISTLATNGGGSDIWTFPLHMYGPDGKKIRTFDCNADLPSGAEKRKAGERQAIATKDYVIFFYSGYLRLFNKKDGKYVGDIELMLEKHKIDPRGVTADDANHIYFTDAGGDQPMIYRIDL